MKYVIGRPFAGLFLLFAFAPLLPAQTAPAAANPAAAPATSGPTPAAAPASPSAESSNDDQVLQLDQFTVNATPATGYRATNSITATGIGALIGDTPATIDVVTSDLIDDTRSDLINDALRFVPGVTTQPTNESQPFVRGFQGGGYSLFNGVFRRQNLETWDVNDVEVIQGPSSIFYSEIRPGGIINYTTIQPVFGQDFDTAEVDFGSYDYRRVEAAANVGNNVFAVRVDLGDMNTNSFRNGQNTQEDFLGLDLTWKPTANQQITLEYDTDSVHRMNSWTAYLTPFTNTRYWENPAAIASGQTVATWMAANYPGQPAYNAFAPFLQGTGDPYGRETPMMSTYQSGLDKPLDLRYVLKLTDNLFFSAIGNYTWEDNEGINPVIGGNAGDPLPNDTFSDVYAQRFINVRDSYNANVRLTYKVNVANVDNTVMVGDDNSWIIQRYPQSAQPITLSTNPAVLTSVSATNLNSAPVAIWNPLTSGELDGQGMIGSTTPATAQSGYGAFNALKDELQDYGGEYFVDNASLFNHSLDIIAGDRYVDFRQVVYWPYRADLEAHTTPDASAQKWTPELGAIYKIANGPVSLFYTYSESVVPQTQQDISGQSVTPIDAKGWDVGAKLDLLGGALTGTVDYYYVYETNTAIANSAEDIAAGLPSNATYGYYTYGNPEEVKGVQADIDYNISSSYQVVFGVNEYYEASYVDNATPSLDGTPVAPIPATSYFVWNRYEVPDGPFKGVILGGGWNHSSEAIAATGSFNYTGLWTEGFTVEDAMIGYDFKAYGHRAKVQLLVDNLTNEIYRDSGGVFGNPRTWVMSVSTRF